MRKILRRNESLTDGPPGRKKYTLPDVMLIFNLVRHVADMGK